MPELRLDADLRVLYKCFYKCWQNDCKHVWATTRHAAAVVPKLMHHLVMVATAGHEGF
jgi:hypothetical protein